MDSLDILFNQTEQRTEQWYQDKCGKFSASSFYKLLAAQGIGKVAEKYIRKVVAQRITGVYAEDYSNRTMQRGEELEPDARAEYESRTGLTIDTVGFITLNEWAGCSPDGLVGTAGGVEIKCPEKQEIHLEALELKDIPAQYKDQYEAQIFFCMLVTGRKWWDYVSYHPDFPGEKCLMVKRYERDEEVIERYTKQLAKAIRRAQEIIKSI